MITSAAMKNGFTGGLIIDYPNSKKAKKYYLFLMAGYSEEIMSEAREVIMPTAKEGNGESEDEDSDDEDNSDEEESNSEDESEDEKIAVKGKNRKQDFKKQFEKRVSMSSVNGIGKKHKNERGKKGDRNWVLRKKDRQRRQGKIVRPDSKYSGRKRPSAF